MNFVQRRYTIKYFTIMDIISKLGGIKASIVPIANKFTPIFVIFFLILLVQVIQEKQEQSYKDQLISYLIESKAQLLPLKN